jgi:hypothetical protein
MKLSYVGHAYDGSGEKSVCASSMCEKFGEPG